MKIGDLVIYIHNDNIDNRAMGYYPPMGTLGIVVDKEDDDIEVAWAYGATKGNGIWWCNNTDVIVVK
jgi:hypothetical protein